MSRQQSPALPCTESQTGLSNNTHCWRYMPSGPWRSSLKPVKLVVKTGLIRKVVTEVVLRLVIAKMLLRPMRAMGRILPIFSRDLWCNTRLWARHLGCDRSFRQGLWLGSCRACECDFEVIENPTSDMSFHWWFCLGSLCSLHLLHQPGFHR